MGYHVIKYVTCDKCGKKVTPQFARPSKKYGEPLFKVYMEMNLDWQVDKTGWFCPKCKDPDYHSNWYDCRSEK